MSAINNSLALRKYCGRKNQSPRYHGRSRNRLDYGTGRDAQGVFLSLPKKQEIMDYFKRKMQDGHLHFRREPELMNEMGAERFQLSKTGQLQFLHPSGTHDDRLWAFALAVYASRYDIPTYHPVAAVNITPKPRQPDSTTPEKPLASIVSNNCPVETGVHEDAVVLLIAHVVGLSNRLIM